MREGGRKRRKGKDNGMGGREGEAWMKGKDDARRRKTDIMDGER